jgi:hypothetical protein
MFQYHPHICHSILAARTAWMWKISLANSQLPSANSLPPHSQICKWFKLEHLVKMVLQMFDVIMSEPFDAMDCFCLYFAVT